jgi:hypothetical protein
MEAHHLLTLLSLAAGIILSGNEISQILSILLIYYGGSGHRPRWIAVGVGCSAISCLVLALPHAIYGPGQDALALTKEHLNASLIARGATGHKNDLPTCSREGRPESCDEESLDDTSAVPRLLVFFSQFILGIGTTLYYGLGQTYMDDNTKKKNTPMLLGSLLIRCDSFMGSSVLRPYFYIDTYLIRWPYFEHVLHANSFRYEHSLRKVNKIRNNYDTSLLPICQTRRSVFNFELFYTDCLRPVD